jgi:hypothetical protein
MQFRSSTGSKHTSQLGAYQASQKPPAPAAGGDASADKPSIQDNPEAMQCIDQLKQMGYTAEDVSQAMDEGGGMDGGAEATKAAPLQIPGV